MTEIALSTCKAKVSVSFRYCTNISCFFSSPSSPSFSPSFCGVGGKFWLSSAVSSSEPGENIRGRIILSTLGFLKNNSTNKPFFLLQLNYSTLPAAAVQQLNQIYFPRRKRLLVRVRQPQNWYININSILKNKSSNSDCTLVSFLLPFSITGPVYIQCIEKYTCHTCFLLTLFFSSTLSP